MKYSHFNSQLDTLRNWGITKSKIAIVKIYEKNIPKNCPLQTFQKHWDIIMLCWGLCSDIKTGYTRDICKSGKDCMKYRF